MDNLRDKLANMTNDEFIEALKKYSRNNTGEASELCSNAAIRIATLIAKLDGITK